MVFNLFFGLFFLRPAYWILLEVVLVVLFLGSSRIMVKKIVSSTRSPHREDVIDVEGEVVAEKKDRRKLAN